MGETSLDLDTTKKRHTLWIVCALNAGIAIGFFITGTLADSNALIANGLDNSSDAVVYALSLLALSRSRKWKRGVARFCGWMLLVFAVAVVIDAVRRFIDGSEPGGLLMMAMAAIAAVVNVTSLVLLRRLEQPDVNLRSAIIFSLNDFVANGGVIVAGILVMVTSANWPDLVVGIAVAAIAAYGGGEILREAHVDVLEEKGTISGHRTKHDDTAS